MLETYLYIAGWVILISEGVVVLFYPTILGKPRPPLDYTDWIVEIVEGSFLIPVALRVLGII